MGNKMQQSNGQRKAISKKTRFEVFKRDGFTCQYCGMSSPDVVLQVDHIKPVKNGGKNNILNYVTSCIDCNQGKGSRELSDDQALNKQRKQLEELNERREQLKMMVEWKESLEKLNEEEVEYISNVIRKDSGVNNFELSDKGKTTIKNAIHRYGFDEIYECSKISVSQYFDGNHESFESVVKYIPRIANRRQKDAYEPYMKDLYYIRGILNNRLPYCNKVKAIDALKKAYTEENVTTEELKELALTARNWTDFRNEMWERYEVEV